ncbi:hypothetical protein BTR23_20470 [Alkalihalophilus pseudofirmus]|nr:hypothetical protein BTR23_20470 [Alkalihalophilus pseudofirmus]
MIKLTFCICRLPHLTHEEFDRYWKDHHAELVRSYAKELRIRRYIQVPAYNNQAVQEKARKSRAAEFKEFDGIAELWWDSLNDLISALGTPEGAAADKVLLEDEKRFIDLSRSRLWYGVEREIISIR